MIKIAIDGPSGGGKSTLAKRISRELGIVYVDTGALYRTVGYHAYIKGIDKNDVEKVTALLPETDIELTFKGGEQHVLLNGEDLGDKIRQPIISMYASAVSAMPAVRAFLLETQRKIARTTSVVMDGRDIGTVILPDADVKIFLCASNAERARRRCDELIAKGQKAEYEQTLKDIKQRDHQDSTRPIAPLKQAKDAVLLDTSELDIPGVLAAMKQIVREKISL